MRFDYTIPVRQAAIPMLALAGLLATTAPVCAQGFGLGARIAWITPDADADVDSVRFVGGQVRLLSQRFGLEVALDRHSESFELLNQKVTETPIQASLLLRLAGGSVSPFLLGGPGWYRRKVEALDSPGNLSVSTTEFGWHAASRSCPADISVSTATTAIRSSTSTTTTGDSSVGFFRATGARCGRLEPPSISRIGSCSGSAPSIRRHFATVCAIPLVAAIGALYLPAR
ncbi:MAG TPA: hypothetical protein VHI99_07805 [Vicinamibacterales bacterium]|nr:hypothetical protein [Vicinamibacterales bacterium]